MSKFQKYIETQNTQLLYEFANLSPKQTGLDNIVIHAYSQGDGKKVPHGPRIKVSNVYSKFSNSDNFVIEIKTGEVVEGICRLTSKELKTVRLWIALNKQALVDYWDSEGEMITLDFFNSIKPL